MSHPFSNIAILGGGLLGGSLALALENLISPPGVRLWSRREETTRAALARGIAGATGQLGVAVDGCDLLVLAVPVGSMAALLQDAIAAGLPANALVTDVGSVKSAPHRVLGPLCHAHGTAFVGSHPMAGSEQGGIAAASARIFDGAACLLTNDEKAASDRCAALETFWHSVGCHTTWMDAAEHDACVARISHLPHIAAAATANLCMENSDLLRFAGGGLRDTTRVAAGNPAMWAEILTENQPAVLPLLRGLITELETLAAHLATDNFPAARQWLETAKQRRDSLPSPQSLIP